MSESGNANDNSISSSSAVKKEGYLLKYANFVRGYKKCYCIVKKNSLFIQKNKKNEESRFRVDLTHDILVEWNHAKDSSEITLVLNPSDTKPNKVFLKAKDEKDRDEWLKALHSVIDDNTKMGGGEDQFSNKNSDDSAVGPHREAIYDAFQSKLFIDECDLDSKFQAFAEIQKLFNKELESLQKVVADIETEDQGKKAQLAQKAQDIKNVSKTMGNLIQNIVSEVDSSRGQMFKILESIAVVEINRNAKQFKEKSKKSKNKTQKQTYPGYSNSKKLHHRGSTIDELDIYAELSEPRTAPKKNDYFGSDDESKEADDMKRTQSAAFYNEYNFDSDLEEELFQDAQEEIILDTQQVIQKKSFIQDVFEERLTLPHLRPPKAKISIWTILKDLIGKDLTRISMPVYFNEPLSMNQKLAETTEYNEILEKAATEEDPQKRLALVTVYSISRYAHMANRNTKPFNPLLGETYELVTYKYRLITEQVSHHPPITAFNCEGPNYEVFFQSCTTTKFNGRYAIFIPTDRLFVNLKLKDGSWEKYSICLPNNSAHNLIIGTPYIDIQGKMKVFNHTNDSQAEVEFYLRGWNVKSAFQVNGETKDKSGAVHYKIKAFWNRSAKIINVKTGVEEEVWHVNELPEKSEFLYHFSKLALQLNYLPETLASKIAPNDSRFRPDQRALENGDTELATKEKNRLEEAQRARRKQMEESKTHHQPVYFRECELDYSGQKLYVSTGQYWIDRQKQDWTKLVRIFE